MFQLYQRYKISGKIKKTNVFIYIGFQGLLGAQTKSKCDKQGHYKLCCVEISTNLHLLFYIKAYVLFMNLSLEVLLKV